MSLNPLNELKRRLEDEAITLPKRLCLAKNVVASHHFPTAPKESMVACWLQNLADENQLDGKVLKDVLGWIGVEELTSELKNGLIQVASQYVQNNQIQENNIYPILLFLENDKITAQLTHQIDDYLVIVLTLLRNLKKEEILNVVLAQRLLNNLVKYYKECKKKLEFIVKLLDGINLETLFSYLETDCHRTVVNICQNVLFPMSKKSFFVSFLQTLIRKENIDDLMAEKGDNIQSVLKIMTTFFTFPKGRTEKNQKFLSDFIDVFVSCFKNENQLIFAFYVMVVSSLNMNQSYLQPAMKMPLIIFEENDEKIKRNLFFKMMKSLLKNEVDISVRLTDTFGEKISKVEIKKNFMSFLQTVMLGQLKLEGKLDKITLEIIKTALKLDPVLIEQKIDQILPPIMTAKKTNPSITESYIEMMNCLLEILFKLSRGTIFFNQIIPHVKLCLEAGNTEQFELKQKVKEAIDNGNDCEKLKSKLITGSDVFPPECVEMYGKWTSELMFRQNKELLLSLQKDFEENCLMMLEAGFVSPSIITLTEVLSAILSSFLRHSKMADQTVPKQIAEDFWNSYQKFEVECLGKLGEYILKLSYDTTLNLAFLNLSLSIAHLKLLNIKYSHTKLNMTPHTSGVLDLSALLPCLNGEQWTTLASRITDDEAVLVLDNLVLGKTMAFQLVSKSDENEIKDIQSTKNHLIKQLNSNSGVLDLTGFSNVLFTNLDKAQSKQVAKNLVKLYVNNPKLEIFGTDAVVNNRLILNATVLETAKNITKCFENSESLTKGLNKNDFDLTNFVGDVGIRSYFEQICLKADQEKQISNYINIFKQIPLPYLEENYQLIAIFVLLAAKKCCQKKNRKNVDYVLLNLYELSPKYPDLHKIFPVDLIFSFEERTFINLLTLKIKTSNNLFIIKSILESAVKKVKTDSDIVKNIVEILLSKQKRKEDEISTIEYFSDPAFQITCIILPIIAKHKKAITVSAYRSILANLQEKLHISVLDCFKSIDFGKNISLFNETIGNTDESMVVSENTLATLNAIAAYSLTLSKYCETTDLDEIKNLDYLWSGLEFFVQNAINSIQNPLTKNIHVDSSIQLLNVILRHIKKLESHSIFNEKDKLFIQIWKAIIARLLFVFGQDKIIALDDVAVTLKFLCELISVECFSNIFVEDFINLQALKKPSEILKEDSNSTVTAHKVSKYLWTQCLKANLMGPKCVSLSKLLSKTCKELRLWMQMNYEDSDLKKKKDDDELQVMKVDDAVCEVLRVDLDIVSEAVLAAMKITLDYKLLDSIFCLQHTIHCLMGGSISMLYEVSWPSFFKLFEGCIAIMNNLLVSREELLEDRWPNYMQCYRALLSYMCQRASSNAQLDRSVEEKLAETAHCVEKLTQSLCKRKTHVSRIAAYSVADICFLLEKTAPSKMVRQHLENSAALLLQAADSTYAAAFLRRSLASSPGHVTLANMYTLYKRYHKYTGNS